MSLKPGAPVSVATRGSLTNRPEDAEKYPAADRKHVQAEAMGAEDRNAKLAGTGLGTREERECPYCAEKILVKAKVCRFCGREVPPVTT